MAIDEVERVELGKRIKAQRERVFGTKKDAYQEAEVNAATWDKAEAGESVRGDRLRRIVRILWPETEGDWTMIGVAPPTQSEREADALAQVAELARELREVQERLGRLERGA